MKKINIMKIWILKFKKKKKFYKEKFHQLKEKNMKKYGNHYIINVK